MASKAKRAAIIARVSTENQDTLRQVQELTNYAKTKGFSVSPDDVFEDVISGYSKKENREELNLFFAKVEMGEKFDGVFFSEVTRVARKPIEGHNIVHRIAEEMQQVVYIKQNDMCSVDDNGKRSMAFYMMLGMLLEIANHEAETFKSRSKSGALTKVREVGAGSGVVFPYGYMAIDKKLVVNPEEAEVVKRIFQMSFDGLGVKKIAAILNRENIPTRMNKVLGGKQINFADGRPPVDSTKLKWAEGTLQGVLTNPIYKGERRYAGEIVKAPAIISAEFFDEVQKRKTERFQVHTKETKYHFILNDILVCGVCGKKYSGRYKERYGRVNECFYKCGSTIKQGNSCGNRALGIPKADGVVWAAIAQSYWVEQYLSSTDENKLKLKSQLNDLNQSLEIEKDILAKVNKKSKRLKDLFLDGDINKKEFDTENKTFKTQVKNIEDKIAKLQAQVGSIKNTLQDIEKMPSIKKMIKTVGTDPFQIRDVLVKVVDRVVIVSETTLINNDKYLITVFIKGGGGVYPYYYNKKENLMLFQPAYQTMDRLSAAEKKQMVKMVGIAPSFDQYGRFEGDVVKTIASYEKPNLGLLTPNSIKPDPIPFSKINLLATDESN